MYTGLLKEGMIDSISNYFSIHHFFVFLMFLKQITDTPLLSSPPEYHILFYHIRCLLSVSSHSLNPRQHLKRSINPTNQPPRREKKSKVASNFSFFSSFLSNTPHPYLHLTASSAVPSIPTLPTSLSKSDACNDNSNTSNPHP